jgi:predicted lysophospholipase L1 biosynthesis ABC-type transport system permease subunit
MLFGASPFDKEYFEFALRPNSRWFTDEDFYTRIVSSSIADELGIKVGDCISVSNLPLKVVGILDDSSI